MCSFYDNTQSVCMLPFTHIKLELLADTMKSYTTVYIAVAHFPTTVSMRTEHQVKTTHCTIAITELLPVIYHNIYESWLLLAENHHGHSSAHSEVSTQLWNLTPKIGDFANYSNSVEDLFSYN